MLLLIERELVMSCDCFLVDGSLLGWSVRLGLAALVRMADKESKRRTDNLYEPSI